MDAGDPTRPVQLLTPEGVRVEDARFGWRGGDAELVTIDDDSDRPFARALQQQRNIPAHSLTLDSAAGAGSLLIGGVGSWMLRR